MIALPMPNQCPRLSLRRSKACRSASLKNGCADTRMAADGASGDATGMETAGRSASCIVCQSYSRQSWVAHVSRSLAPLCLGLVINLRRPSATDSTVAESTDQTGMVFVPKGLVSMGNGCAEVIAQIQSAVGLPASDADLSALGANSGIQELLTMQIDDRNRPVVGAGISERNRRFLD